VRHSDKSDERVLFHRTGTICDKIWSLGFLIMNTTRIKESGSKNPQTGTIAVGVGLLWIRNWRTLLLHMRLADAACALTRWQHFSAWNDVMTAALNVIIGSPMRVYLKNNPVKFQPDPTWNDVDFKKKKKNNNNNNKMSSNYEISSWSK